MQTKWIALLCLLVVLVAGAYLRFSGIDWDENYHLHPDERFLTMVETSITSVSSIRDYFDTGNSTLNPHNVIDAGGNQTFPFFVYGTFPIFLVRFIGELLELTGYSQIHIVGRYLSGILDLGTVLLVYIAAKELFGSRWTGVLSAAFYSFAALPIQISHYFIVDNFSTFFTTAALFFAARIMLHEKHLTQLAGTEPRHHYLLRNWDGFAHYAAFALMLGLAAASKLNAVVAAILLPLAVLLAYSRRKIALNSPRFHIQLRNLVVAGLVSFVFFRIFQPYAFSGPGFFNFGLNEKWLRNLSELRSLSSGLSNYPPSLQWTRRSMLFPIKNMILWGMGISFGITSFTSIIIMTIRAARGKADSTALLLVWNAMYILWQAVRWNPTMRYFLLVYPTMAISAGWLLSLGLKDLNQITKEKCRKRTIIKTALIILSLGLSIGWGFAFASVYRQPMTRIEASQWIYKHVEGPINLVFTNEGAKSIQPIPYRKVFTLAPSEIFTFEYQLDESFAADQLIIDHVLPDEVQGEQYLEITLREKGQEKVIFQANALLPASDGPDQRGPQWMVEFPDRIYFSDDSDYQVTVRSNLATPVQIMGTASLRGGQAQAMISKSIFTFSQRLQPGEEYRTAFTAISSEPVSALQLFRVRTAEIVDREIPLEFELIDRASGGTVAAGQDNIHVDSFSDQRGSLVVVAFEEPVLLVEGAEYDLLLRNADVNTPLLITGSQSAKETDWDDALPLFMYGMNPFDLFSGVYQSDLNFQTYWDDNTDKLARFIAILDQSDYIIISSNRQWGSVTQAQEKYPLTVHLYEGLLECGQADVQSCYIDAQPTGQSGALGFELIKTFHVQPKLFGISFNTQKAEEAFSVYDHPKVFIFKKADSFTYDQMVSYLDEIDLDRVLNISPQEIEKRSGLLDLPDAMWANQRESGTWSKIFHSQSIQNTNQVVAVVLWYVLISAIGWISIPLTRIAFAGLLHRGWGLSRLFGLVLVSFIVWVLGSAGVPVTRPLIGIVIIFYTLINVMVFFINRKQFLQELRSDWRALLKIELLFLGFFMIFLLIRAGNPDLWHPYKGGEKPMDFAYFNALIKSESFPPYDPWYAGGYINYYYWGFLLAALPTKLTGIIPSIAYNLVLPTFFAMTGIGAFTVGVTLHRGAKDKWLQSGLIASGFILLIGNLGTIKLIFQGFGRLGKASISASSSGVLSSIRNFLIGISEFVRLGRFDYYPGDWYWIPSRAIPGEPITEFPFFTFLYGDPHAHLFAYPITLLVICWAISTILRKWDYRNIRSIVFSLMAGALIVGALRPTNTWDYPLFLIISCASISYAFLKFAPDAEEFFPFLSARYRKIVLSLFFPLALAVLSVVLFLPFTQWYGQAYTTIRLWDGSKTPLGAYITHWGIFLFIIVSWLAAEVVKWMKVTPLSRVTEWRNNIGWILSAAAALAVFWAYLLAQNISVSLITIPVVLTAFLLVLRRDISDIERIVLLLVCAGFGLTLVVEFIVLSGDIGRMNTVFKFYLQAWTCIGLAAAFAMPVMVKRITQWTNLGWKSAWQTILILLLVSGVLYPLAASVDKITDRIAEGVPLTLDGMDYMQYAQYPEDNTIMNLSQDHQLIRWIQENLAGTPRIIEANIPEYRWGSRVSIYTGLPGVVGWNWHQRQQRAINPGDWVFSRVEDVNIFYSTTDREIVEKLLNTYQIEYVVVGQLERIIYPADGIDKFETQFDSLFVKIFEFEDTILYRVERTYD